MYRPSCVLADAYCKTSESTKSHVLIEMLDADDTYFCIWNCYVGGHALGVYFFRKLRDLLPENVANGGGLAVCRKSNHC